jgi:hypothetical protein
MKSLIWICIIPILLVGCSSKPLHSDRPEIVQSAQSEQSPERTDSPAPVQTQQAAPAKQGMKPPAFFDQKKGQIKDLPSFPNASVINIGYGPINGQNGVFISLQTLSPFEEVAAFYDKAIKSNGWTVINDSRTPGSYVWQLKKGEGQEARVQVKDDQDAHRVIIGLARIEKQPNR